MTGRGTVNASGRSSQRLLLLVIASVFVLKAIVTLWILVGQNNPHIADFTIGWDDYQLIAHKQQFRKWLSVHAANRPDNLARAGLSAAARGAFSRVRQRFVDRRPGQSRHEFHFGVVDRSSGEADFY